jgi:hypothetical protein
MARKILNGIDLNGQRALNVGDPSASTDAANKQYVDNLSRGLLWKAPVRVSPTANVNVANPGTAVFDGVTAANGESLLLKAQTAPAENGIWTFNGSGSALTRRNDADNGGELAPGTAVTVTGDKVFAIISDAAITIGTTSQTWGQVGGGLPYTGSNGVNVSGQAITAVADPAAGAGILVTSAGIKVDPSVVARKFAANIGNGAATSIAVAHNLGTKDVTWSLRDNATDAFVDTDGVSTDANTLTLTFPAAPATNAYRVVVTG